MLGGPSNDGEREKEKKAASQILDDPGEKRHELERISGIKLEISLGLALKTSQIPGRPSPGSAIVED